MFSVIKEELLTALKNFLLFAAIGLLAILIFPLFLLFAGFGSSLGGVVGGVARGVAGGVVGGGGSFGGGGASGSW